MSLRDEAANRQGRERDVDQPPLILRDLVVSIIVVLSMIAAFSQVAAWR